MKYCATNSERGNREGVELMPKIAGGGEHKYVCLNLGLFVRSLLSGICLKSSRYGR